MALLCLAATLFAVLAPSVEAARATHPKHLVMVVIDDLGFDDMGYANGGQIATPNFNQMHDRGIALSQYYVQPSCSPTRATLLTGRKPVHTGINFWIPNAAYGLPLNETTLAQVMNARGFKSHAVGKWHLGCHKTAYLPTFRGFDSFYGYYEGSEDYWTHNFYGHGLDFHFEDRQYCAIGNCSKLLWDAVGVKDQVNYWDAYSTNLFTDRACEIIRTHHSAESDAGLFLYLAYQGVHEPRQSPEHYYDKYNNTITDLDRRQFGGMLSALDEGLANVTTALKESATMYDDALFIVTTDNGGPTTECSTTGQSNWPLRGEGGTKGTGFLFWAGLPPAAQGLVFGGLIHAADWLPTAVAGLALRPLSADETLPLDGIDMWTTLLSNATSPRTHIYYGINQASQGPAVRDVQGYKLMVSHPFDPYTATAEYLSTNDLMMPWFCALTSACIPTNSLKGEWSLEQLPNTSSSTAQLMVDTQSYALLLGNSADRVTEETMIGSGQDKCHIQAQVCYPGNDLLSLELGTVEECCAACAANNSAIGFTFRQNGPGRPSCFLKNKLVYPGAHSSCISGYKNGSHPVPPVPPPPPAVPAGHLLYNVIDDMGEHTPLDATTPGHSVIVAKLQAIADKYALTKVPQAVGDPECPQFSGLNTTAPDGSTQLYIGPWCDGKDGSSSNDENGDSGVKNDKYP